MSLAIKSFIEHGSAPNSPVRRIWLSHFAGAIAKYSLVNEEHIEPQLQLLVLYDNNIQFSSVASIGHVGGSEVVSVERDGAGVSVVTASVVSVVRGSNVDDVDVELLTFWPLITIAVMANIDNKKLDLIIFVKRFAVVQPYNASMIEL
eukprot:CAMPEP_0197025884 /NCGR_PEP_ID=MMETSP1384-20130603/6090_1 /TAXON_ID=29189 /ORGANISM="Ammonia sp." /LENGTH=147 /DNA_ID=CAMNT_0042454467 /DNA_START=527 /DNA_END=967 /DNA_ORIENTATION=+